MSRSSAREQSSRAWGCRSVWASPRAPGRMRSSGGLSEFWKELHFAAVGGAVFEWRDHMTTNILPRSVCRMGICLLTSLTGRDTAAASPRSPPPPCCRLRFTSTPPQWSPHLQHTISINIPSPAIATVLSCDPWDSQAHCHHHTSNILH